MGVIESLTQELKEAHEMINIHVKEKKELQELLEIEQRCTRSYKASSDRYYMLWQKASVIAFRLRTHWFVNLGIILNLIKKDEAY